MLKIIKSTIFLVLSLAVIGMSSVSCFPDFTSEPITIEGEQVSFEDEEEKNDQIDKSDVYKKIEELVSSIVTPPVVLSHESGQEIFASGEKTLIFLKGKSDAGNTIEIYVNGSKVEDGIKVGDEGVFEALNGIEIKEGNNNLRLVAINENGDRSKPTEFELRLIVPQGVQYQIYDSSETLKLLEEYYYVKETNPTVYIQGNYTGPADIYLQVNGNIVGEAEISEEGVFSFESIGLDLGQNDISLWAVTEDDYVTSPSKKTLLVYKDLDSPRPSMLSGYVTDIGNSLTWSASTEASFASYKLVRVENPCSNPEYPDDDVIATFEDMSATTYLDEDVEAGKSYYYTLWTLDRSGSVVSSNVLAIPEPKYSITIEKIDEYTDNHISRREWYYQYYEIKNTGNVTLDIQPLMVWLKLEPEPTTEMLLNPLWEVHIWDPQDGTYYYSNEDIEETYISDYANTEGTTEYTEAISYSADGTVKTVTETSITRKTAPGEGKRIMTVTNVQDITTTDLTTGISTLETSTDLNEEIVEPEKVGSPVSQIQPGERKTIAIKVQNIYAKEGVSLTVHFWFVPIDCAGYYFTDELVSTGDILIYSSGR